MVRRIAGLWIAVVLVALALPSVSYRILAGAAAAEDLHAWRNLIRFGRVGKRPPRVGARRGPVRPSPVEAAEV